MERLSRSRPPPVLQDFLPADSLGMSLGLTELTINDLSQMVNDDREPDKKPVQQNPQKWLVLGGVVQLFPGIEPSPHRNSDTVELVILVLDLH